MSARNYRTPNCFTGDGRTDRTPHDIFDMSKFTQSASHERGHELKHSHNPVLLRLRAAAKRRLARLRSAAAGAEP